MFFHTQTALPTLRAGAGLNIRGEAAAAELWIRGGFLCVSQVLQKHAPPTRPYLQ